MEKPLLLLLTIGACMTLSFLFSGMEAGVFALSRLRIRQQMRAGRRRAKLLHGYLEHSENFLWTILIGNTLANFVAACLVVRALYQALAGAPLAFGAVFLVLGFFFYVFCDLLPKVLFRLYPNRLCLALVVPFRFLHLALSPLVALMAWLANWLLRWTGGRAFTGHLFGSREELRSVMLESAAGFSTEERAMISRVLDLQNLTVRAITVPWERVVAVTAETPAAELLRRFRDSHFTRLPVWHEPGGARRVAGIVSLKDFLYAAEPAPGRCAADYLKPALYLDDELRLEEALRRMQRSGQRLAIVLGRDRRELGVVSVQDILKTIFGEMSL